MEQKKTTNGFTLVELIIVIAIIGLVFSVAGQFLGFSFMARNKTADEYDLQADVRLASTVLNNAIRNASVTFSLPEQVFAGAKKDKWNYFGIENRNEIVQYTWNSTTNTHERSVLLDAKENIFYNLTFRQSQPNTKLLEFSLEAYVEGREDQKIAVHSELEALNSVAVEDGGSADAPAVALAYRSDAKPKPEEQTTNTEVQIAIALVLDDSGSMAFDMNGRSSSSWNFDRHNVRTDILQAKAKALVDQFAALGNIQVSIIPFANDADDAEAMRDATTQKDALKTSISRLDAYGGTNTGDGLRRAYYMLYDYNSANSGSEVVNYIILLTDGNPTYYSSTSSSSYVPQDNSADCRYVRGSGQQEEPNMTNAMNYVQHVGQNLVVGQSLDIRTFVIGFTAISSEVSRARSIAEDACTGAGDARKGTYYAATSAIELESVFNSITTTILQETWHIYGPW